MKSDKEKNFRGRKSDFDVSPYNTKSTMKGNQVLQGVPSFPASFPYQDKPSLVASCLDQYVFCVAENSIVFFNTKEKTKDVQPIYHITIPGEGLLNPRLLKCNNNGTYLLLFSDESIALFKFDPNAKFISPQFDIPVDLEIIDKEIVDAEFFPTNPNYLMIAYADGYLQVLNCLNGKSEMIYNMTQKIMQISFGSKDNIENSWAPYTLFVLTNANPRTYLYKFSPVLLPGQKLPEGLPKDQKIENLQNKLTRFGIMCPFIPTPILIEHDLEDKMEIYSFAFSKHSDKDIILLSVVSQGMKTEIHKNRPFFVTIAEIDFKPSFSNINMITEGFSDIVFRSPVYLRNSPHPVAVTATKVYRFFPFMDIPKNEPYKCTVQLISPEGKILGYSNGYALTSPGHIVKLSEYADGMTKLDPGLILSDNTTVVKDLDYATEVLGKAGQITEPKSWRPPEGSLGRILSEILRIYKARNSSKGQSGWSKSSKTPVNERDRHKKEILDKCKNILENKTSLEDDFEEELLENRIFIDQISIPKEKRVPEDFKGKEEEIESIIKKDDKKLFMNKYEYKYVAIAAAVLLLSIIIAFRLFTNE